jgi:hypothetical protein
VTLRNQALSLLLWCALAACGGQRFESLGAVLPGPEAPTPVLDAGAHDAGAAPVPRDAAMLPSSDHDAMMEEQEEQSGPAAQSGADEDAGSGGLTGTLGMMPFSARVGYICGEGEEYDTVTLYLFDTMVSCAEISGFAWLAQLPSSVHVIEIVVPMTAPVGSPVSGSRVSAMRGGTYSFAKTLASTSKLVLTSAQPRTSIEGNLTATFAAPDEVDGFFHADFCETARTL